MTTLKARMAWAIPISPDLLGAHLQAYVELLPTLNTLRLCNRFGTGDHVGISKLPVELISIIEDYVAEDRRCRLKSEWTIEFACWEHRCSPTDHYTQEELIRMYRKEAHSYEDSDEEDMEADGEFMGNGEAIDRDNSQITRLTPHQLEVLNELEWETDAEAAANFRTEHRQRELNWKLKTGTPTQLARGFFGKNEDLVKKHFGLDVYVSHTHAQEGDTDRWWKDVEDSDHLQATLTCLALPVSTQLEKNLHRSEDQSFDRDRYDCDCTRYNPTENGFAVSVAMPSQLPANAIARFARAMKILRLKPNTDSGVGKSSMFTSDESRKAEEPKIETPGKDAKEDGNEAKLAKSAAAEKVKEDLLTQPQLMLLIQVNDSMS